MSGPPTSMGTSPTALTSLNSPLMVWSIGSVESVSLQAIRLMSSMSVIRMTFKNINAAPNTAVELSDRFEPNWRSKL